MTAKYIVADVMDGLASLETGSVDVVITSPPFLALRSYLPADHPDKGKEIGSEATPAEFIDTLLKVTAELRRVLAPHGSICVELGDTYAGSTGAGGDYQLRDIEGRQTRRESFIRDGVAPNTVSRLGQGWPLAKSRTLIPSLYQIALVYGFNPLTGQPSPAGQWRIRNVVTWARPNPPVGALGDKWRPATSDLVIACTSGKRYWDDLATRKPHTDSTMKRREYPYLVSRSLVSGPNRGDYLDGVGEPFKADLHPSGAPLLDYWVIPPGGYQGAHYAVFPEELVVPCVQAMCPQRVCRSCGEPSRRIVETEHVIDQSGSVGVLRDAARPNGEGGGFFRQPHMARLDTTLGWTDCGHDNWRPGLILDPFAGSGTTLAVATGHGYDAIGIDIDSRNAELARDRVGPFLFDQVTV